MSASDPKQTSLVLLPPGAGGFPPIGLDADQVPYGPNVVGRLAFVVADLHGPHLPAQTEAFVTNRKLADIIKNQKPLVLAGHATVQEACRCMWERRVGSVLVVGDQHRLTGIFTGRDAVGSLAEGKDGGATILAHEVTLDLVTIALDRRAIDALRKMSDCGFRHLPVVASGSIWGAVSRGDFKGMEIDRLDEDNDLWECVC
jgi:CBS domain-containing protein